MKNVSKKLLAAIAELGGSVPKTGYNSYSKYKYVTEADINGAVLPALIKQGLLLTTSVESVKEEVSTPDQKNRFASVVLVHSIIDTESGETLQFKSTGTGADTLDKAVYKAYTGSCKYFLMKTFMLSGDDDPENDGANEPAPAAKPATKGFPGAPAKAAPPAEKKGFLAKKTETAPVAPKTEAKKPSFMPKKAAPVDDVPVEVEAPDHPAETSEEDAQF